MKALLLAAVLLLPSCVIVDAHRVALVHLETGDYRICAAGGALYEAALARKNVAACAREYEFLGYTRARDLTTAQRKALRPKLPRIAADVTTGGAPKSLLESVAGSAAPLVPLVFR